jgi:hypothetical protein
MMYVKKQNGSVATDLIEIGCAFAIALAIGWAFVGVMA